MPADGGDCESVSASSPKPASTSTRSRPSLQDEGAQVVRGVVERADGGHRLEERHAEVGEEGIADESPMQVLVIDIGGTNVKILATGQTERRKFPSGKTLTPRKMVAGVKKLAQDWKYDVVSIGYPGQVVAKAAPVTEPRNLAHGWVGFDFAAAFGRPVKVINDAAMQALGSYNGGNDAFPWPRDGPRLRPDRAWAHRADGARATSPTGRGPSRTTSELAGSRSSGKKKWRQAVEYVVARLDVRASPRRRRHRRRKRQEAEEAPPGCRLGNNANAFLGGFRLWEPWSSRAPQAAQGPREDQARKRKERHMKNTNAALTARPAWKALEAHHQKIRDVHLRQLFADDPKRGERLTAEAAGLFLDYSKNRITDETLKLLLQLAEECGLASASTPCSAARRSTSRRIGPSCTWPCARREAPSIVVDGEERRARGPRRARQDGRLRQPRPQRRVEGPYRQAHPQRRSTSASAAPTSDR